MQTVEQRQRISKQVNSPIPFNNDDKRSLERRARQTANIPKRFSVKCK